MFKVDLHTHSKASPDGSLMLTDYRRMLEGGRLDYIAVTDHNTIANALEIQKELGGQIIVGEEVSTPQGDIVGLYLQETIPAGLPLTEVVRRIKGQGGLVYIPHPFETVRHGLSLQDLEAIADDIDIVESYNGRSLQNRSQTALDWAIAYQLPYAASSDAHGRRGWGATYSIVGQAPTVTNLAGLLAGAEYSTSSTGIAGRLYPTLNRQRNRRRIRQNKKENK